MLIILDANIAHEFTDDRTPEARCIANWLAKRGKLATGGKNLRELMDTRIRDFVQQLSRGGRTTRPSEETVYNLTETFERNSNVTSNDQHILALALAAHCRLLFSNDQALIADFKNVALLPSPKGRIYRDATKHEHLLR